jgi:hypothetical protein
MGLAPRGDPKYLAQAAGHGAGVYRPIRTLNALRFLAMLFASRQSALTLGRC